MKLIKKEENWEDTLTIYESNDLEEINTYLKTHWKLYQTILTPNGELTSGHTYRIIEYINDYDRSNITVKEVK